MGAVWCDGACDALRKDVLAAGNHRRRRNFTLTAKTLIDLRGAV
jgi:hypothetical protein